MDEHYAQILILYIEEKAKIIIRRRKKSKQKWAGKLLHFSDAEIIIHNVRVFGDASNEKRS
jgi:hypothetical protein